MGSGTYSSTARVGRAIAAGYYDKPAYEIFVQDQKREVHREMSPYGVTVREARDSEEHPNSLPIIVALDVTGSMGMVPHELIKDGLPHIVDTILKAGISDPQLLFMGIGDHECGDQAPLQVGQFESSDELMDKWLTSLYREGGGGGNKGESYMLAWYFAATRTSTDHFEKRGKKGFLFTIGDEPCLPKIEQHALKRIMGPNGQYQDFESAALLKLAQEKYEVFHVHIRETYRGKEQDSIDDWKQRLGENLFIVQSHTEVPKLVANTIVRQLGEESTTAPVKEKKEDEGKGAPKKTIL